MPKIHYSTAAVSYAGPIPLVPSTQSTQSPPPLKRKRKTQGSTEGDDGLPILGDDEISNEDYRCGGPGLVRYPVVKQDLDNDHPLQAVFITQLKGSMVKILQKWGVDFSTITLGRQAHDNGRLNPDVDTITVHATKHALDDSWFNACKEIRRHFVQKEQSHLCIEIIDKTAFCNTLLYAITVSDSFARTWKVLRPLVLDVLGDTDWTVLSTMTRDTMNEPDPTTILVVVREESTHDWTAVREAIVDILDLHKLGHVAVEIRRGSIEPYGQKPSLRGLRDWDMFAHPGGSIGVHGSDQASSTFGGFLELQLPSGEWKLYGVASYSGIMTGKADDMWDKHGIRPDDIRNDLYLDHPSLGDHISSIKQYRHELSVNAGRESYIALEKRILEGACLSRSDMYSFDCAQQRITDLRLFTAKGRSLYNRTQLLLGKVYAASGHRRSPESRLLDWALIDVMSDRLSPNEIPQLNVTGEAQNSIYVSSSVYVEGVAYPQYDIFICKTGRSGFTDGEMGKLLEADVQNWFQDSHGDWKSVKGTAYQIFSAVSEFGSPGDSGSFVTYVTGAFIGLLIGGVSDVGVGLFMRASDLFEDIKLITGAQDIRIPEEF
ncbi:uncharacterized protein GIQ15_06456 [Arthroderma uncinatum]|uniref:uncharacterized protein n=1 Tax=Arthroderma uncinatum TaxID=74035 RepID=UPI00144AA408|nr:uncharacterized protein GIQ15_06456 [Arthroderma uncinatum]KAF3479480.1 hypothetical protein GIQ15_06456 [Arthroderma uncinatum]